MEYENFIKDLLLRYNVTGDDLLALGFEEISESVYRRGNIQITISVDTEGKTTYTIENLEKTETITMPSWLLEILNKFELDRFREITITWNPDEEIGEIVNLTHVHQFKNGVEYHGEEISKWFIVAETISPFRSWDDISGDTAIIVHVESSWFENRPSGENWMQVKIWEVER